MAVIGLCTAMAEAKDEYAFLKPEAIRAAYEDVSQSWQPAPPLLAKAFVAAEDKIFFERSASLSSLTRSVGFWYPAGRSDPSLPLSIAVGQALSHDEILDWFLHEIFLGQSCFGIDGASMAYFGKAAKALSLQEAALLAALPKAPSSFHPVRNAARALERRNWVLKTMVEQGLVNATEAEAAIASPLDVLIPLGSCTSVEK